MSVARHYSKGDARVLKLDILAPINLDILVLINEILMNEIPAIVVALHYIEHLASAYVSQHTSSRDSIRRYTSSRVSIRHLTSAYVISRQHTSAYVSIRHLASAYVSIRQIPAIVVAREYIERLSGKDGKLIAF